MKLSERLAALIPGVATLETTFEEQVSKIAELEERIKKLTSITTTPPDIPPVTSSLPDVSITFAGRDWKPSGEGELWQLSGERRWRWNATNEITIVLDAVEDQRRIILHRSWVDDTKIDPITRNWAGPTIEYPLSISLDGVEVWNKSVRVHPQTRPCMTFRRRVPSSFAIKVAPNYSPEANATAKAILSVFNTSWQWDRWEDVNKAGTFDNWSENYGLVIRSWTGGIPLSNEGALFPTWDVALMLTGNKKLWEHVSPTWDTAGNYPIHFFDRKTGEPFRPETIPSSIPVLKADGLPVLMSKSGVKLPVGDIAHDFGLCNYAALLTGERYYVEELEAWTLLGEVVLAHPSRAAGIYLSGQWRSTAWRLRNLFHLFLSLSEGAKKAAVLKQLTANINALNKRYADPNSPEYHPTGVLNTSPFGDAVWLKNATPGPISLTGNLHFLAHVINEIRQADIGLEEVTLPILRHLLKVARGTWEHSPSRYMAGWLKHVRGNDWRESIKLTFNATTPYSSFAPPLTADIVAWWRAAVVAAVETDEPWAVEALAWVDAALKQDKKQPSISWMIEPS